MKNICRVMTVCARKPYRIRPEFDHCQKVLNQRFRGLFKDRKSFGVAESLCMGLGQNFEVEPAVAVLGHLAQIGELGFRIADAFRR